MALSSLRSLTRNAEVARARGIAVQLIAILDKPDQLTREIFESFALMHQDIELKIVLLGDLGYARNEAAVLASGKWICFLDADDIWSDSWIADAYAAAESEDGKREVVWHPEINVYFGTSPHIYLHRDMDDPRFDLSTLAYINPWTALAFVSTSFLRRTPYCGTDLVRGIGYEDWSWNIEVLNQGAVHKVVPGSTHAIRTKPVSLVSQTTAAGCIPRPTDFLRRMIGRRHHAFLQRAARDAVEETSYA
ncbi:glycosyltransferase [Paraburkholderia phytofirmans PsJN]|uniref:Glycosyltransferase n=2 Tax=Paraburkholderia phytofirmans TaxID=261302 RepID=B2T9A4_PARPJ|nr:glycosyltransferase [Paraburkholderia phytofirmans PsJN]